MRDNLVSIMHLLFSKMRNISGMDLLSSISPTKGRGGTFDIDYKKI